MPVGLLLLVLLPLLLMPLAAVFVFAFNGGLATGAGTGASWANACRGAAALQNALDAAAPIAASGQTVQLWVAGGTYLPTTADGAPYFHRCPPLSLAELTAAVNANKVQLPVDPVTNARETPDVAITRRRHERATSTRRSPATSRTGRSSSSTATSGTRSPTASASPRSG